MNEPPRNDYFKDQICFVTGANSGIGFALSEEHLKRGATVCLAGRDPKKVSDAAGHLSAFEDRVHPLQVDVTSQTQVRKAIEQTAAPFILDRVAERKGIIIVPEGFHDQLWRGYVHGDERAEEMLAAHAHNRRVALEEGDPAAAAAAPMHR
ncbi:MAG TPA: SDR family NAD(P)-dependent oxidoreductase [Methanolinea sp.]|nr:SDR family NAD(P)-dependent oxidoreductase [Methanolinea sp.]